MVRLFYLPAFLGMPAVIQAGLITPRSGDADTTIRGTVISSMFETIVRHSPSSPSQSATKTADIESSTTSANKGASVESPADHDISMTKASTSSFKDQSPVKPITTASSTHSANSDSTASPLATKSSRTSAKNKFSASSVKSEPSTALGHAETWETSATTETLVTSVSGEASSTPDEEVPSATTVDRDTTETSIRPETPETSAGTATQTTSAAPTHHFSNETAEAEVLPPSQDPWYSAPDNFAVAAHGELIKSRETPGNLTSMLKNLDRTHQLMYRYDGTWGKPTWAVTTVLSPKKNDLSAPNVVTYQAAYNSANIDGSPSYLLSTGSADIEWHILDRMLDQGWHVSLPDYEGPSASFGAGKMAGHAVLDAMRAVHYIAAGLYGVDSHHLKHIAWGYSGGALATAWAFRELRSYASWDMEKKFNHYVIGGFPRDPIEMIKRLDGHEEAGIALHALSGLINEFRHINGTIQLAAKRSGPFNITVFDRVKTMTRAETKREFAHQTLGDYFVNGLDHVVQELRGHQPREQKIDFPKALKLESLTSPRLRERKKLLIYHGVHDELAPIEKVDELIKKNCWCQASVVIEYHRNHEGGHMENQELALDTAMSWMKTKFRVMQFWGHEGGTMEANGEKEHYKWEQCDIFQKAWNR